jgi:integrase
VSGASAAAAAPAVSAIPDPDSVDHVLVGVGLTGPAARLAGMLQAGFLIEAGWDPAARVLSPPAEHPLLGRTLCRVGVCLSTAHGTKTGGVCWRCFTWLTGQGLSVEQIACSVELPALPARPEGCAVTGCQRMSPSPSPRSRLPVCGPHRRMWLRRPEISLEQFLADLAVRPLPALQPCLIAACSRRSASGHRYCPTHYVRWRTALAVEPGLDERRWQLGRSAVSQGGQVSLRGLTPLVVVEVLFGVQQRVRGGAQIKEANLRAVCDTLRREQAPTIAACPVERVPGKPARSLASALVRHVRRALTDPGRERAGDSWDLALFGHRGQLSFTGIGQPWLAQAAKVWAGEELPRHRGGGANNVRERINALARLSESLRVRDDHGQAPERLGRPDIEAFLNRLAYLESAGTISRYRRNVICRGARQALAGIRALGLTRPTGVAAGLPGDFALGRDDIPAEAQRGEPGRDLPAEIMAVLCANLDSLQPAEVRTATQIGIDTGRRPEDILNLRLDCLARDKDGGHVLVYDNAKADRLARRLPINQVTAAVITAQQARVRERFPDTSAGELRLLPSPRRNPDGHRAISIDMLDNRHREWADGLPALHTSDGAEFDKTKITPYAWRHSYAQRHADAGVGIDVLAELLDHRNLNVTRGYYRVGEDRRRAAVDTVTAMSFDRHGNRIWREAANLLDSEHARYAVAEVAVPYGRCSEPSNVQAGGGACPVRFRCAGCDHFRTDASYLPDLSVYLDDLLQTRERLAAAIDGVDEWARADATPSQQEITRIRRLIGRINGDLNQASDTERAVIDEAVTVMRRHRAVSLGLPRTRVTTPDVLPEATTA